MSILDWSRWDWYSLGIAHAKTVAAIHHLPMSHSVWPKKNRQMSIKVAQKWLILTTSQKLPKNVGDLGKLIVAQGFKKSPKV